MNEQSLKPNPFLAEVELLLAGLGLEVEKAKQIVPNGALFYFNFNEVPVYLCVPTELPSPYSNITRLEAEVAELDEVEAGQLIVSIATYLQIESCSPIRVAAKRTKGQRISVLLSFVCDLGLLQTGALAAVLLNCCELADSLRQEMVTDKAAA
jgi:hypothetical protein